MKILLIGFLVFCGWSSLSTYIYVCKIRKLCDEPKMMRSEAVADKDVVVADSQSKPIVKEQSIIPEKLVIYFAFDKSEFNANTKSDMYFNESNVYLEQNLQVRLKITGHTDAIGTDEYNQSLGYRRAQTMQHYFENKGIPANRIIIESKGEKEPVTDNNSEAGRAKNRRAEITIKN